MVTDSRCTGRSLFVLTLEFTYKRVFKGERENLSIDSFTLGLCALIMELDVRRSEIVFREKLHGSDYSVSFLVDFKGKLCIMKVVCLHPHRTRSCSE